MMPASTAAARGSRRPKVRATPASLITALARTTSPSASRTPTARPPSTTISLTSAEVRTAPPARSIVGRMVAAICAEPPTG
jgi:hypothetical protein